jgi:hypothetical protein
MHAKQELYHLSYTPSPFVLATFQVVSYGFAQLTLDLNPPNYGLLLTWDQWHMPPNTAY